MSAFESAIAKDPLDTRDGQARHFTWQVPDAWQQGRGAWGGLAIGAIISAVEECETEVTRAIRAVSLQLPAPAMVGLHRIRVEAARTGTSVTTWSVEIIDAASAAIATARVITGAPRAESTGRMEGTWSDMAMPSAPPSSSLEPFPTSGSFPAFAQHFDFRVVSGLPLTKATARTQGWISYREAPEWTSASLLALADGWYTAALVSCAQVPRIATVNFTASLLVDPATLEPGTPLLHEGFVSAMSDGYATEHRRLWAPDGRLVVDNVQTIVVG